MVLLVLLIIVVVDVAVVMPKLEQKNERGKWTWIHRKGHYKIMYMYNILKHKGTII